MSSKNGAKLHQILAIETGIRAQTQKDLTKAHHGLQREGSLFGISRNYEPLKEDGERLPPERTLLQTRTPDVIRETIKIIEELDISDEDRTKIFEGNARRLLKL